MRWVSPSLLLIAQLFSPAQAQQHTEPLIGAPLPAGYTLQSSYSDGGVQVITAGRQDDRLSALALARDRRTGRTLWKTYSSGILVPQPLGRGQGLVNLLSVQSGAVTNSATLLLRLDSGRTLAQGLVDVAGVTGGKVLLVDYDGVPPSAPFLCDGSALSGRVISAQDGRVLTLALPTPPRDGCGPAEVRGYQAHGISSNKQRYHVAGETLTVPREDRCGTFNVLLRWTQVPLSVPTIQPGN
ncbi:hypothetical protein [Deinococcus petrolearius]|uniref:Uncharacterized protein n=1 Tax=Deinococcus petrolearius TaxID=1751295 RepID=A0ABW1DGZ4_9DEIO